jgi:diguanylate cyclase (GGDEF)-like protein
MLKLLGRGRSHARRAIPTREETSSPALANGEMDDSLGPFDTKTARYDDLDWLKKYSLEKKVPTLLVLRGSDAGLRIPLVKESVTMGRTIDSDIVFHDDLISRRHAMIVHDLAAGTYSLVDLDSTNGTAVNSVKVGRVDLKDGDKIFLGSTILKFVLQDDVESESSELVDRLMFQDDLTGLVVKRRFYNDLKLQIGAAGAGGVSLSVFMMDLDGLKKINDSHGHPVGAFIISEVGKKIGDMCNPRGQACRYGGDEFIAYLRETPKTDAFQLGETICKAIKAHVFEKDALQLRVSISIGVAAYPEDGKTLETLTRAADEALYRAKAKGRDRVSD